MARSTSLRAAVVVALIVAAAAPRAASQQPVPATPASFDGHDSTEWARRFLGADREAAIATLVGGKRDSLPVLRELLVHDKDDVTWAAARALEAMGPDAAPLSDLLLQQLRDASFWWMRMHCGNALAAIGVSTPAILDALLHHVTQSDVLRLRAECTLAFAKLHRDPSNALLAAFERGEFAKREYAIDALLRLDDRATDALIAAVREQARSADLAEAVLLQRGWRAVPALERAGMMALAKKVLVEGPLHRVRLGEYLVSELSREPAPLDRLPAIEWAAGAADGKDFELGRAFEDAGGLRIVQIRLQAKRGSKPAAAVLRTNVLPRATAFAFARQLAVLPCLTVRARDGMRAGDSASLLAAVRAADGERVLFDAAFRGVASHTNTEERFVPEAARAIIRDVVENATWESREPGDADRAFVETMTARLPASWDVQQRSRLLLELLAPR